MAEKPRRYKLSQASLSGRGSKLDGKVHGVREGASGYKPPEGDSGEFREFREVKESDVQTKIYHNLRNS